MPPNLDRLVRVLRDGVLDTELAALVWLLAEGGIPVHLAASDPREAEQAVRGLEDVVHPLGVLEGRSLEDVLDALSGEPASLGVVLVFADGRVVAAHWVRPPLRDAGGHVRPQPPAVLTTWDASRHRFEHFAWGIAADLAQAVGRRAGDFEIELAERREQLDRLVGPRPS